MFSVCTLASGLFVFPESVCTIDGEWRPFYTLLLPVVYIRNPLWLRFLVLCSRALHQSTLSLCTHACHVMCALLSALFSHGGCSGCRRCRRPISHKRTFSAWRSDTGALLCHGLVPCKHTSRAIRACFLNKRAKVMFPPMTCVSWCLALHVCHTIVPLLFSHFVP